MPKRRIPTKQEIKRAICDHSRMDQVGVSERRADGDWQSVLACPSCGWTFVHVSAAAVGGTVEDATAAVEPLAAT